MSFNKPPSLAPGDEVYVVAPAGPFDRSSFEAGLQVLARRYRPVFEQDIFSQQRYLAGSDARRLAELERAFSSSAKAIFCARGGYGAMRLLPQLSQLALPDKHLIGFSDITALHALWQRERRVSIHGPVLTQLGRQAQDHIEKLFTVLESSAPLPTLHGQQTLVGGQAEGLLVGGNLSVFSRLLGTPYMPELSGAVLLLEDVGERPYRLDRMWTHLALAGVFNQVKAIVLGEFTLCEEKDASYGSGEILRELAESTRLPTIAGLPVGHGDVNVAVPLGVRVRVDADACSLTFLEGATRGGGAA